MSCLSELTCSIYVDGELSAEELRPVETHLVQCRRCRERVMALREEAALLADALWERASAPAPGSVAPARGVALGLPPALAAAAAAMLAGGWILESLEPVWRQWLGPFTLGGATDMAFNLIFLLRDQAPTLFGVALAVAAMASASALLTFALSGLARRWSGPRLLALAALLAAGLPAPEGRAHFDLHRHEDFTLAAGETHAGTLLVSAENADIDGVVEGDLLVLAHRLTIRGQVRGNLFALAKSLELPGEVAGSAHLFSSRAAISGRVDENLYAFAEELILEREGSVAGDVVLASEDAVLEGSMGRDLVAAGDRVEVRGDLARNLRAWAERLALQGNARVGGDVEAALPRGRDVEVAEGARVAGEVRSKPFREHGRRGFARLLDPGFYLWMALHLGAGFLAGMLLRLLLPGIFDVRVETSGAFFRCLAVGFLVAVAGPVALLLTGLTVVGIPVALMGAAVWVASLYVGVLVVSAVIGAALVHPRGEDVSGFGRALLAGLAVVVLATHLPFFGPLLLILAVLTGLGLLAERARRAYRESRRLAAGARSV